jgi:hypothetical protein
LMHKDMGAAKPSKGTKHKQWSGLTLPIS